MSSHRHAIRASVRRRRRRILFDAQRRECWICGPAGPAMVLDDPGSPHYATFDELTPRGLRGAAVPSNQLLAHAQCNHARGCKPLTPEQVERVRALRIAMGGIPLARGAHP